MILQSGCSSKGGCDFSRNFLVFSPLCPCRGEAALVAGRKWNLNRRKKWGLLRACVNSGGDHHSFNMELSGSAARNGARNIVIKRFSDEFDSASVSTSGGSSNFASFQEDPIVDKLRTQLGVIHPMPSPPINRNILGLFAFFFFVGVVFDKVWTSRKKNSSSKLDKAVAWPQVPTNLSSFLEKDLQRKESVEWVNMVLGKLWKVYRAGIENWIIGLLQPVIDDLKKPDYVEKVEIKQFSLGEEPLSVRSVERRTSRRVNDLQYVTCLMILMLYYYHDYMPYPPLRHLILHKEHFYVIAIVDVQFSI